MLSGIKFIPREELLESAAANSDSGSEDDHHAKWKKKKSSSFRRGSEKKKKKTKKQEDDDDEGSSEIDGEEDEERLNRSRRRKKKSMFEEEEDSLSDSSSDDDDAKKRRKHGKGVCDDIDIVRDKEVTRKEMGLEWMLRSGTSAINDCRRAKMDEEPQELKTEEVQGAHPRELNPYLKDNGSGYPDDALTPEAGDKLLSSSVVGDGGASWRLKALKRAKEQAAREGRKLQEVVEERWDSLGELAASVADFRAAPAHAHLHAIKDRKRGHTEISEALPSREIRGLEEVTSGTRGYLRDVSSRNPEMRKPRQDSLSWKRNKSSKISLEDKSLISGAISGLNQFANDGSFMDNVARLRHKDAGISNTSHGSSPSRDNNAQSRLDSSNELHLVEKQVLSANQLAAKVLQLRMKGKHDEADRLSKEMETMVDKQDAGTKSIKHETERSASRYHRKQTIIDQKRREEDADLHLARTIMQNRQFSLSGREDDEYGFDVSTSKKHKKRKDVAEEKSIPKQLLTQKERCQFCFENPSRPKHLVISIANFTYLMLPQRQPVVEGHCCIVPMQHEAATRTVDKNVWEEIRNFKKCLLKMFARHEKSVVFLETVIGLSKQRRHCLLECIPLPNELAEQAPMYFRKAIEEAEEEWGQHDMKKVIPTSGNLRQVIPENFAYFHAEFGLDRGFVHVIDEDSNFSSGFGLNVIRGMLQLPEEDMFRRRRHETMEKQKQAAARFAQEWEPFDWTREID